jgi:hypothetical protein
MNKATLQYIQLFAGSGISTEKRHVFPFTLKQQIDDLIGNDNDERTFPETMSTFTKKPNGRRELLKLIKERFDYIDAFPSLYQMATMFHMELASIPQIQTIITTNWDTYFEKECDALPIVTDSDLVYWDLPGRKVIKFHGSMNNIGSIIATKEDYSKCYNNLGKSAMGGILKTIFSTKTVVFVGYSLQDEDFKNIYNFLNKNMKELMPHAYMVTLDETILHSQRYKNITPIITDGAYFLQILKVKMYENNLMHADAMLDLLTSTFYKIIYNIHHEEMKEFSINKYPVMLHVLSYQDGILAALQRYFAKSKGGLYFRKGYCKYHACSFDEMKIEKQKAKKFADVAYISGYQNALILLNECEPKLLNVFPYYYQDKKHVIMDKKEFKKFIKSSHKLTGLMKEGKQYIKKYGITSDEIVFEHTPFLL